VKHWNESKVRVTFGSNVQIWGNLHLLRLNWLLFRLTIKVALPRRTLIISMTETSVPRFLHLTNLPAMSRTLVKQPSRPKHTGRQIPPGNTKESCDSSRHVETSRYSDECDQAHRINHSFNKVSLCIEAKRASIFTSGSTTQKSTILRTKIMKPFDSIRKSIRRSRRGSSGILNVSMDLAYSKALNNVSSKASVTSSSSVGNPFSLFKYGFGLLTRCNVPSAVDR
jgi:hypothetical protein